MNGRAWFELEICKLRSLSGGGGGGVAKKGRGHFFKV
jgi:hypothetical protein